MLLAPCIDYVVTFAHLGRADARLLLAATPTLLIAQMLLPVYLRLFVGDVAADLVQLGPFVHAFVWLIAVPLALAAVVQLWAAKSPVGLRTSSVLGLLPEPATAPVLFIVILAAVPQIGLAIDAALSVVPVYIAFALAAPLIGWGVGRLFRLAAPAAAPWPSVRARAQFPDGPAAGAGRAGCDSYPAGIHRHADAGRTRHRVGRCAVAGAVRQEERTCFERSALRATFRVCTHNRASPSKYAY